MQPALLILSDDLQFRVKDESGSSDVRVSVLLERWWFVQQPAWTEYLYIGCQPRSINLIAADEKELCQWLTGQAVEYGQYPGKRRRSLRVRDNSVASLRLDRIFVLVLDGARSRKQGSTGLGLSVSIVVLCGHPWQALDWRCKFVGSYSQL